MNFNISPAFEKCTENLSKLGKKRYRKKRKKKNGWKMNRVENRYMTSLCDKLFGAGKKVSGHNWLMWTCTDVNFWFCRFQISAAGWCQLVDVNLPHRCHWLVDDPRRLCHWRDVTDDPHRLQISVDVTSPPSSTAVLRQKCQKCSVCFSEVFCLLHLIQQSRPEQRAFKCGV